MGQPEIEEQRAVEAFDVEQKKEYSGDVDAALEYLAREDTTIMTDIDEKKLVRKIDFMIVPLMWLCYFLQYLDKTLSKSHSPKVQQCDPRRD